MDHTHTHVPDNVLEICVVNVNRETLTKFVIIKTI